MITIELTHRQRRRFGRGRCQNRILNFGPNRLTQRIGRREILIVPAGIDRREHCKHRFARVERHLGRILGGTH